MAFAAVFRSESLVQAGVPLNLLQRRLWHAQLTTTAIYANAMGPEERNVAAQMWA